MNIKNNSSLYLILGLVLLLVVIILATTIKFSPLDENLKAGEAWKVWVKEKDKMFISSTQSPLENKANFQGLKYFPYDSQWAFTLKWNAINSKHFIWLATQSDEQKPYLTAGYALIEKNSIKDTLWGFKDPDQTYSKLIFFPFSDSSNGFSTYPTGRFMELPLNDRDKINIDFNFSFNPFCAYNKAYICPIPPGFNHLKFNIEAGEKYNATNP